MDKDEAMDLALKALEKSLPRLAPYGEQDWLDSKAAITAIKQARSAPVQEPVGCEGAIVNGRVYADRLEHDYKFECEAGPLHLCNDWIEFCRCFEWLATHTTPPAAPVQEPVAWATMLGSYSHVSWGKDRPDYPIRYEVPLYTTPPAAQREWVGLTEWEVIEMKAAIAGTLDVQFINFARAIEAKLKEKNT